MKRVVGFLWFAWFLWTCIRAERKRGVAGAGGPRELTDIERARAKRRERARPVTVLTWEPLAHLQPPPPGMPAGWRLDEYTGLYFGPNDEVRLRKHIVARGWC